ncbi:4-fold beta flower protein [Allosphingosinicella vermicomposti]|uniref:4-fold beta flower protein n=1 Tax=Allosphingosinicella vermicomposti TaxID=614671 RepID=UPI00131A5BFA|nr:hypothetical protein [Allosphingosinicella vermicomposti]
MPMYVYHAEGYPVGFRFGDYIHDMNGDAVGRILGSHVFRLDGAYVGEWFKETVVAKPTHTPRPILPMKRPDWVPSPGLSFSRRAVVNYGYEDVFHLLAEPMLLEDEYRMAAE